MDMNPNTKTFDCIKMKREIQERLYKETHDMNVLEFREHLRKRIAKSRFSSFLEHGNQAKPRGQ